MKFTPMGSVFTLAGSMMFVYMDFLITKYGFTND